MDLVCQTYCLKDNLLRGKYLAIFLTLDVWRSVSRLIL